MVINHHRVLPLTACRVGGAALTFSMGLGASEKLRRSPSEIFTPRSLMMARRNGSPSCAPFTSLWISATRPISWMPTTS
jgi:hypothetical protein